MQGGYGRVSMRPVALLPRVGPGLRGGLLRRVSAGAVDHGLGGAALIRVRACRCVVQAVLLFGPFSLHRLPLCGRRRLLLAGSAV